MFSPASNRLRDATATVRTRSPLGTPPLSASETNSYRPPTESPTLAPQDKLTHIFNAVRQQIQRWGDNAKWKIDLVLLDNNNNDTNTTATKNNMTTTSGNRSLPGSPAPIHHHHPHHHHAASSSSSPRGFMHPHPTQLAPQEPGMGHQGYMLPVSRTTQYPMDYVTPTGVPTEVSVDELKQQLHDSFERQRYLENIVRSQAEQIQESQTYPPDANKAIETMRSIYMMSENEQKLRYLMDTKTLHKDMEALSRKLKRLTSTLHNIETMKLPTEDEKLDRDTLLEERKILKRKLHLAELRLNTRDAELEYLYQVSKSSNSHPSYYPHHEVSSPKLQHQQLASFTSSPRRGPPYLFQQQYSPKMRHEIRPPPPKQSQSPLPPPAQSPQQQHTSTQSQSTHAASSSPNTQQQQQHMSALESLGIVADRMLNDPDFSKEEHEATKEARRSKRSIDSANALLSMPTLKFPARKDNEVIMEETESKDSGSREPSSKKARIDSPRMGQQQAPPPDARHSPTIAALLDQPTSSSTSSPTSSSANVSSTSQHPVHVSPHATPPLAHAHEAKATGALGGGGGGGPSSSSRISPTEPGYRPPSPASTPKGLRQQHQAR